MKTSIKIWSVVFLLTLVGSLLLSRYVFEGITINNGIAFNFSTLGIIGLIFSILNFISGTILFFKFIKIQPFNRVLFFSTVPMTLTFATICYFLLNLNSYTGKEVEYVRALLQVNTGNYNNYLWLGLAVILYLVILFITFHFACKPLKKVENAVYRLGSGRIANDIHIGGSKQFVEIEHSLNKINETFKEKENILEKTNNEYEKFVPKQFLKFLGKNSVLELELGNQVQKKVTTMYVDIHNSTNISTTLSLEENFNYINGYLNVVSPIIRKFGGFVDKYLGDGILAVFIKPQSAVECSAAITKAVATKNKTAKMQPNLDVYISIHTGDVVFGVVGEEERKSPTIISDTVNLVSKMQEFNKYFGSQIIFSKSVLNSLKIDYPLSYRYVGTLTLGDKEYLSLFESLECYPKKTREKLEEHKTIFEQGVRYFNLGKCHQAKEQFQKLLKYAREDKVAYMYFNKCEQAVCGEAPLRLN
ncbi:MAG: adenylate/guanylate cyclase domain-containing protein [Clostridia bacterium]|nr:adenylate/guanylate cyclase domain-containing protein [Clostridia bacterium]